MNRLIEADFGIRQLHARFADAVWRQDAKSFAECFASNGVWKIAGMRLEGREVLEDAFGKLVGRCRRVHLLNGQPLLQLEGDGAIGRVSMTEFAWMPDESQFYTVGYYHDEYVEEDGAWRFATRHWSFKYRGQLPIPADLVDTPDYGPFPVRPDPDEETFVRKA